MDVGSDLWLLLCVNSVSTVSSCGTSHRVPVTDGREGVALIVP